MKTLLDIIKSFRFTITLFLSVAFLMNFVFLNAYIPTGSMENTIMTGDRVVGIRFIKDYKRGDIAVFKDPDGSGEYLIKRIIGLPGDTITITNGEVYVNNTKLDEPYIKEEMAKEESFAITLPEEGYFVMGDNRNDSFDARYWYHKVVYKDDIIGIAKFRYWPVNKFGSIQYSD